MTDLRQAAQMALEALEGWEHCDDWVWPVSALEQSKRNTTESLAALRAALEQQAESVGEVVEVNNDGFRCEFNRRLAVGAKLYIAPPLPVQEPKKRCCDHDSDCAIHNGDALPVGPCDCSQTFISSPDLGIVVTVSHQLAVRELAKLVENNFGQMPRNDEWADKVLLVRDTFDAAHNKGAKP